MSAGKNRVQQTPSGTWFFKFKFEGDKYCHGNFDTQSQAEHALQLQYKTLNLTTTGQKRGKLKAERKKHVQKFVEINISVTYNAKYKVQLSAQKIVKTFDTLEQARAFRDGHKKPCKQRVIKPRQPKQKTAIVSTFADKTERAKQAVIRKNSLNKAIAELNDATRVFVEKTTPTIAELSRIAKTKVNPRQYYIEQLKAGAYSG